MSSITAPSEIESLINLWALKIIQSASTSSSNDQTQLKRCIVAIAGIPGSGKTTFATRLVNAINNNYKPDNDSHNIAVLIGLDGWHYPRATLDTFSDPAEAHRRRGARFTFDGDSFIQFIQQLCPSSPDNENIPTHYAPSFAHQLKDPVSNSIPIYPHHRIIIFEGLYLLMDIPPWNTAFSLYDHKIFINVDDKKTAIERLESRHFDSGVEKTREQARDRAINSDMVNGDEILKHLSESHDIVKITLPKIGSLKT